MAVLKLNLKKFLTNVIYFKNKVVNNKLKVVIKMDKDKIEVFGRICSQEEIEHVFLKAKKLQEENKILKEGLQKFRSVGV